MSLIEFFCREKKKKRKNSIFHWQDSRREIGNDRSIDRRGNEGKSPGIGCELARFLAGLKESAANGARTTQRRAQKSSFVDRTGAERGEERTIGKRVIRISARCTRCAASEAEWHDGMTTPQWPPSRFFPPLDAESNLSDRKAGHPRYSITGGKMAGEKTLLNASPRRVSIPFLPSVLQFDAKGKGGKRTIKRR